MSKSGKRPLPQGTLHRWITAALGLLFVSIAVCIVVVIDADNGVGAYAAALVIGGLGVDALVNAARGRSSLLLRIGGLP